MISTKEVWSKETSASAVIMLYRRHQKIWLVAVLVVQKTFPMMGLPRSGCRTSIPINVLSVRKPSVLSSAGSIIVEVAEHLFAPNAPLINIMYMGTKIKRSACACVVPKSARNAKRAFVSVVCSHLRII